MRKIMSNEMSQSNNIVQRAENCTIVLIYLRLCT